MATGSQIYRRNARILMAWHGMAWVILAQGCAPSRSEVDADVAAILDRARAASSPGRAVLTEDLGPTLARGQEIRHAFRIENPTDRPWKVVGAEALTPCCSAIGALPESIPPGGSAEVPVLFKPGHQNGRKRVEFVVRTDDPDRPLHRFALVASLISELEVVPYDDNPATLPLNAPGRHRYTILTRRVPTALTHLIPRQARGGGNAHPSTDSPPRTDEGRRAPTDLTVTPPLTGRFLGPPTERLLDDGTLESAREFEVELPPSAEVGARRGEVILTWADGRDRTHLIAWQVTPRLRASPSGLVLRPKGSGEVERVTITIRSDDHPFRITDISGPVLRSPSPALPSEPRRVHTLELVLGSAAIGVDGIKDISLSTDHPDQPQVVVSVLTPPVAQEGK